MIAKKETKHRPTHRQSEFNLDGIVPWGRRLDEYEAFFALSDVPLAARILDVGGGPASFAGEASAQGRHVTAIDPIYAAEGGAIRAQFERTAKAMKAGMTAARYRFNWKFYGSEELVHKRRREALDLFLADYAREGAVRYVPGSLPDLPFADGTFDLALSSHLLFLYGDELNADFHVSALRELMRVAGEVRVFPLLNLDGRPSSHLPVVMQAMRADGFVPELCDVDFEFQIGATKMLRVRKD
ncbi:MAG: methyltransferase domain-containing protein [Parvibaculum sp.]|nr:methyltransferase domain-containing protein [Parvibaculum sp.]